MQPHGRSAAASAIAHAASRRRSAGIDVGLEAESFIRAAIEEEPSPFPKLATAAQLLPAKELLELCHRLQATGFSNRHIQIALEALLPYELSFEAALEWLCLEIDASDLPADLQRSSGAKVAASDIAVLAHAHQTPRPSVQQLPQEVPAVQLAQAQFQKTRLAESSMGKSKEDERKSQNAWILGYLDQEDGSDADSAVDEDDTIHDWELWGDPREIERRKAERKKANIPPEVRRTQVAAEWVQAKQMAAAAKSAGDKARQKEAGTLIRDLKLEMKRLGLTEQELEAEASTTLQKPEDSLVQPGDGMHAQGVNDAEQMAIDQPDPAVQNGSNEGATLLSEHDDSGSEGMIGFMDDDLDALMAAPEPQTAKAMPAVQPWGQPAVSKAKGKKGSSKGAKQPTLEIIAPKVLLQQFCHKTSRAAPRYQKRPPGGGRMPQAGTRYSLEISEPEKKRPGKRKPQSSVFSLREEDDGWNSIQDAQNAVATLALFKLTDDEGLIAHLPPEFRDLWQSWHTASAGPAVGLTEKSELDGIAASVALKQTALLAELREHSAVLKTAQQERRNGNSTSTQKPLINRADDTRRLKARLEAFQSSEAGQQWLHKRQALPVWSIREGISEALAVHDSIVVSGDTGCGKTTQVPQFLLDAGIAAEEPVSVICTQPRRIAAISVAERVCQEREESKPGSPDSLVGYHVRLDAAATSSTRLLFCTTGILLRRLASDPRLSSITHIVVDEVHERTLQGDFLMALLRQIVKDRRAAGIPLKVILMSATLDSELFSAYFGESPVLTAGGRTFPVEQAFLEDVYDMIDYKLDPQGAAAIKAGPDKGRRKALEKAAGTQKALIKAGWGDDAASDTALNKYYSAERYQAYHLGTRRNLSRLNEHVIDYELLEDLVNFHCETEEEGAVLVFLPGAGEISRICQQLMSHQSYRDGNRWVLALHSNISSDEQRKAFQIPPTGVHKIVVATNIAETSLTIPDITCVIDSGKLKEKRYDASRGMGLLVEDWVSRANALQRKGRAGRVRPGKCYCLYTRHRFETLMNSFQVPEMSRVALAELVLQIHLLELGNAAEFLQTVIEPPPERSVVAAVSQLQAAGALTLTNTLTPLGRQLAQLPLDPRVGKLLVLSSCMGCLSPCLTIAACLSYKSPFVSSPDQQDTVQKSKLAFASPGGGALSAGQQSDHLVMVAAFDGWQKVLAEGGKRSAAAYVRQHSLSGVTLDMIADMRAQFASMLADSSLITPGRSSRDKAWVDDPKTRWNVYSKEAPMIKLALATAFHPQVAVLDDQAGKTSRPAWHDGHAEVSLHPSSVNHSLIAQQFQRPYLVYLEKMRTSRAFLVDSAVVSSTVLCLAANQIDIDCEDAYMTLDKWIRVKCSLPEAFLLRRFWQKLHKLWESYIEDQTGAVAQDNVLEAVVKLLRHDDMLLVLK